MQRLFIPFSFVVFALLILQIMGGTNTLLTVKSGIVRPEHLNQFGDALNEDLVPRGSDGVPLDGAGALGSYGRRFLRDHISAGNSQVGSIMMFHTYNSGGCPEGWMLADGRTISESHYDTEHGAGSWSKFVGSSPDLLGLRLPSFTGVYAVGAATTPQKGDVPITTTGHLTINTYHRHNMPAHTHKWYQKVDWVTTAPGHTFTYNRYARYIIKSSLYTYRLLTVNTSIDGLNLDAYGGLPQLSGASVSYTGYSGSATQGVQPLSYEVIYCMRVVE